MFNSVWVSPHNILHFRSNLTLCKAIVKSSGEIPALESIKH